MVEGVLQLGDEFTHHIANTIGNGVDDEKPGIREIVYLDFHAQCGEDSD